MQTVDLKNIADAADMIIKGYAFTRKNGNVSILNLASPNHAMVISEDGALIESNMDEIEQALVLNIWTKDSIFMEVENA